MNLLRRLLLRTFGAEEFVPFTFGGHPDSPVFIHRCGTVMDVSPVNHEMLADIEAGLCDCENTSPWKKIYVKKEEA